MRTHGHTVSELREWSGNGSMVTLTVFMLTFHFLWNRSPALPSCKELRSKKWCATSSSLNWHRHNVIQTASVIVSKKSKLFNLRLIRGSRMILEALESVAPVPRYSNLCEFYKLLVILNRLVFNFCMHHFAY